MKRSELWSVRCSLALLCALIGPLAGTPAQAQANPVPFLNQPVVPMGAAPGGKQFLLIGYGTGFVNGSVLQWNGTSLRTSYISGTKIQGAVPAPNVASPGGAIITVAQPSGGPVSNWLPFEIGSTIGTLSLGRTDYTVGSNCYSTIAADFNGDHVLDLAVVSNDQANFTILSGNGDGTFKTTGTFAIPSTPGYAATGDFNHDGKVDLAISGIGVVYVFLGNGDGTFGGATDYTMQADAGPLVVADFNGDGNPDMATTDASTGTVAVMVNGVSTNYTVGSSPEGIAVGDYNRDGKLDLAVANFGSSNISILLGNGDGTFQPAVNVATTNGPYGIITADTNNDSNLDLIVATPGYSQTENQVAILLGNGNGTFQAPVNYAVGSDPMAVAAGDFNDDRKLDLAVANEGSGTVSVLLGNGNGTFQTATSYTAAGALDALAVGDFNDDGALDVAGSYYNGSSASVFLQQQTGIPVASLSPTSLKFPLTVVSYSSASMPVTLSNTGTGNLNIRSITATAQFSETNNCGTGLAPGAFCTINVVFTPEHQGTQTGVLSVTDNATGSPQTVSLTGQATFFLVSPLSINFGNVNVGSTSNPQVISIYGEDGQPEKVTFSISPSGDTSLFPYTNTCTNGYVPSHGTCTVSISFAPTSKGTVSANFQINGGGGLTKVAMTGTGQ